MNNFKLIIRILILCFTIQGQAQDKKAIAQGISISNFHVDNLSDSRIKVIVDYSYVGQTGSDFLIYAFPRNSIGNSLSKNVESQQFPLKSGNNIVSIMLAKQPQVENFRSESIRVCMFSKRTKKFIFCQEFLFSKSWRSTTKPPRIVSFRINPQSINKGEKVRFFWDVKNADKVLLFDSYGEIKTAINLPNGKLGWPHMIKGEYMEHLNKSETYILKAISKFGEVEKTFNVTVKGKKID